MKTTKKKINLTSLCSYKMLAGVEIGFQGLTQEYKKLNETTK